MKETRHFWILARSGSVVSDLKEWAANSTSIFKPRVVDMKFLIVETYHEVDDLELRLRFGEYVTNGPME